VSGEVMVFKVGQRVRWERDGRRIEGTVTAVNEYGVETSQDSPPAEQVWHHGPNVKLELVAEQAPATFNVNDLVRIKLKPEGRAIFQEYWRPTAAILSGGIPEGLRPDEDGWLTIQLHEAMRIFGPHITPCADGLPFEPVIELRPSR
jgi:hypothetical protein